MTLASGSRLGPYEILSPLGAGGMGEVYKARDTRLDRTVAIKVLPAQLADDPQFKERFDREAKAIASLTHPHICTLHDVGHQDGTAFLVMEYLEGETLAQRLEKGALPLDQALKTAIEIASALDKAHRAGIVHRDLKPGNIMLTKGGAKLLDFGLAKASRPAVAGANLSMLPTTPANLTAQGTILGTFQYMAPEQIEGHEADARTDIFAFGAVVYEMLTGKKAFEGKSQASLIAAILERDPPPLATLQPLTPPSLERVVRKCLAKSPDDRWQSAKDLHDDVQWVAGPGAEAVALASPAARRTGGERLAWVVAAVALVIAVLTGVAAVYSRRTEPVPTVARLDVVTPPTNDAFSFALSSDGRQLAFVATTDGVTRLWVRPIDQASARPLPGTEGASYPFWSPDGQSIGFFADSKLKRIDLAGTVAQVLANADGPRGGTWNREGVIAYGPDTGAGLMRIAATGGNPTPLTHLGRGEGSHRWPQFLPDGRHFIFLSALGQADVRGVYVGSLDEREPPRHVIVTDAAAAFAPPDHLLVVSQGVLVAYQFDVAHGIVGAPRTVAQAVGSDGLLRSAFSVSDTGVLAHRSGSASRREFIWVDRGGKTLSVALPPEDTALTNLELSPDGQRLAFQRTVQTNVDIWLMDLLRGGATRFTTYAGTDANPIWSADGTRVTFRSNTQGAMDIFQRPTNGALAQTLLLATPQVKAPLDWSSDGQTLLYATQDPQTRTDIWALSTGAGQKPFPVVQTPFDDVQGQFSPDGHWIAYASDEPGRYEIYVQPFPGPGGRWQISSGGGIYPRWRHDGRELYFVTLDGRLMAAPIHVSDPRTLAPGAPVVLFPTHMALGGNTGIGGVFSRPQYSVAADGRFLLNSTADDAPVPITVVLNWTAGLKK